MNDPVISKFTKFVHSSSKTLRSIFYAKILAKIMLNHRNFLLAVIVSNYEYTCTLPYRYHAVLLYRTFCRNRHFGILVKTLTITLNALYWPIHLCTLYVRRYMHLIHRVLYILNSSAYNIELQLTRREWCCAASPGPVVGVEPVVARRDLVLELLEHLLVEYVSLDCIDTGGISD